MERVCSLRNRDGTGVKDSLKIRAGRLDEEEMEALIRRENASLVIDATHPYADQATANIRKACSHVPNVKLLRCLREEGESEAAAPVREMASVKETVSWLSGQEGNILLTTGSKDLEAFRRSRISGKGSMSASCLWRIPSAVAGCRGMRAAILSPCRVRFLRK